MKGQEVSLGCGTLILIAIIVAIFSGRDSDTSALQREIRQLRDAVTELRAEVSQLREDVQDKLPAPENPR